MIKQFTCSDGSIYAKAEGFNATVDEVIEFLEQFRGMFFGNGATGDVAFRLDGDTICCDSADFQIQCASEKDELLGEMICEFFYDSKEKSTTEEEQRREYENDCNS